MLKKKTIYSPYIKLFKYLVIGIRSIDIFKKLEHSSKSIVTSTALLFSFEISMQHDTALHEAWLWQEMYSGKGGNTGLTAHSKKVACICLFYFINIVSLNIHQFDFDWFTNCLAFWSPFITFYLSGCYLRNLCSFKTFIYKIIYMDLWHLRRSKTI